MHKIVVEEYPAAADLGARDLAALGALAQFFRVQAQQSRRLQLFCTAYGLDAPQGLLDMVDQRIQAMCDLLASRAAAGEPAFRKMVDDGHLAHYQRELAAFTEQQSALARLLGW